MIRTHSLTPQAQPDLHSGGLRLPLCTDQPWRQGNFTLCKDLWWFVFDAGLPIWVCIQCLSKLHVELLLSYTSIRSAAPQIGQIWMTNIYRMLYLIRCDRRWQTSICGHCTVIYVFSCENPHFFVLWNIKQNVIVSWFPNGNLQYRRKCFMEISKTNTIQKKKIKFGRHNQPWRLPASARSYVDIPNTLGWVFESMVKNENLFIKNCSGNTLDSKQNCKGFGFSFLAKKNTPMLLEKMNKQIKNNGIPGYPSSPQQSKTPSTPREIAGYFRPF